MIAVPFCCLSPLVICGTLQIKKGKKKLPFLCTSQSGAKAMRPCEVRGGSSVKGLGGRCAVPPHVPQCRRLTHLPENRGE